MKINQSDIYYFGVDYMEVLGKLKKLEDIRFGMGAYKGNADSVFPGFKLRKETRVTNYEYKIVFNYEGVDCFAYHVGQENGAITTEDFLAVYGVAFVLFPNFIKMIRFIIDEMDVKGLRRFDLALDVLKNIKDVHKKFNQLKQKGSVFFDDNGEIQTFYIGEKKKKNNRYKLVRVYNKKDDILIKKRQKLYPDYLKQDDVTRIEIEIRSELAKNCDINNLLDREYIFNLFLTYIKTYTHIFGSFKYEVTRLNKVNKKVSIQDLRADQYLMARYVNIFRGYAKSIIEIGGCPVDILMRADLMTDDTKKDIALSIKDGEFRQDIYEFGLNVRYAKSIFADNDEDDVLYFNDEKYGWE